MDQEPSIDWFRLQRTDPLPTTFWRFKHSDNLPSEETFSEGKIVRVQLWFRNLVNRYWLGSGSRRHLFHPVLSFPIYTYECPSIQFEHRIIGIDVRYAG